MERWGIVRKRGREKCIQNLQWIILKMFYFSSIQLAWYKFWGLLTNFLFNNFRYMNSITKRGPCCCIYIYISSTKKVVLFLFLHFKLFFTLICTLQFCFVLQFFVFLYRIYCYEYCSFTSLMKQLKRKFTARYEF